jgi:SAM-dependent methyltransferase
MWSFTRYHYSDSSFDVVLCCELIEHLLRDPLHLLLGSWRVLKDGGLFVLTTPSISSLTSVWAALDGRHNPQVFSRYPAKGNCDLPHVREYTPHKIVQVLGSVRDFTLGRANILPRSKETTRDDRQISRFPL